MPAFGALADDLTKLIDLYGDWSRRLLPGLPSLAARIDVLEAAGKASALKLELRGVRDGVWHGTDPLASRKRAAATTAPLVQEMPSKVV